MLNRHTLQNLMAGAALVLLMTGYAVTIRASVRSAARAWGRVPVSVRRSLARRCFRR